MGSLRHVGIDKLEMTKDLYLLANLSVRLLDTDGGEVIIRNETESSLVDEVKARQFDDLALVKIRESIPLQKKQVFELSEDGVFTYRNRLCDNIEGLRGQIMEEIHQFRYFIPPMKKNIAEYVAQYPNCQQVKVEHHKPGGLLQNMEISTWKWEIINMDFVTGLPRSCQKFCSIWIIVDRLTKLGLLSRLRIMLRYILRK
ncbi:uncharacterized protein [Nicotiana tomentosiformis]|uniref:uncharacterized protein n=1 Tax=Nicotiana tomentosiformis TaxID=4098 RepID=UPI00388C6852